MARRSARTSVPFLFAAFSFWPANPEEATLSSDAPDVLPGPPTAPAQHEPHAHTLHTHAPSAASALRASPAPADTPTPTDVSEVSEVSDVQPDSAPSPALAPAACALDRFNAAPDGAAEAALLACCGSRRWARRIAGHRPYPDLAALLAAAAEASYDLTSTDLTEALADESVVQHPPSGSQGPGTLAAHTALRAAHAAYESKFGHVFVLCLDGVPQEEVLGQVLASIRTRLGHQDEKEREVAADELRRVAQGRLAHLAATTPRGS